MNTTWLGYYERLNIELLQCRDEGKDISGYEDKIKTLDELVALPVQEGYTYQEPSDLDGIRRTMPFAKMIMGKE